MSTDPTGDPQWSHMDSYVDALNIKSAFNQHHNDITFNVGYGSKELIRLCENGDIFVKGNLIKNDLELVIGMRAFLAETGHLKQDLRYHASQAIDQEAMK